MHVFAFFAWLQSVGGPAILIILIFHDVDVNYVVRLPITCFFLICSKNIFGFNMCFNVVPTFGPGTNERRDRTANCLPSVPF
jgi:hypothetical protein